LALPPNSEGPFTTAGELQAKTGGTGKSLDPPNSKQEVFYWVTLRGVIEMPGPSLRKPWTLRNPSFPVHPANFSIKKPSNRFYWVQDILCFSNKYGGQQPAACCRTITLPYDC